MSREPNRPAKTEKWKVPYPLTINLTKDDVIEYSNVNHRGSTIYRSNYSGYTATVIIGKKELDDGTLQLFPTDKVFMCIFGRQGHLSSLPPGHSGKDVTIIISKPVNKE